MLGVLCWMGAQVISILQLRSGTPHLKDFIGAGPQRLQCSRFTCVLNNPSEFKLIFVGLRS